MPAAGTGAGGRAGRRLPPTRQKPRRKVYVSPPAQSREPRQGQVVTQARQRHARPVSRPRVTPNAPTPPPTRQQRRDAQATRLIQRALRQTQRQLSYLGTLRRVAPDQYRNYRKYYAQGQTGANFNPAKPQGSARLLASAINYQPRTPTAITVGGKRIRLHPATQSSLQAPVLRLLDYVSRPYRAATNAVDAAVTGKNVLDAAGEGFLHGKGSTGSDILKHLGVGGAAATVGGFGLDYALDPLSHGKVGTGRISREDAALGAYRHALRQGETVATARKVAKAAYKGGEQRAGLAVSTRLKLPLTAKRVQGTGSGRVTAALARGRRPSRVAAPPRRASVTSALQGIRRTPLAQATGKAFAPDFRPKDISPEQWSAFLDARRRSSANERAGLRYAERRAHAFQRAAPDKITQKKIIDAIETGQTAGLPAELQPAAHAFQAEMARIAGSERRAGVLGATRQRYVPHIPAAAVEGSRGALPKFIAGRKAKNPHALQRTDTRTLAQQEAAAIAKGGTPTHTSDLPLITAGRLAKSARVKSDSAYLQDLAHHVGRPLTGGLGKDEMAYVIGPSTFRSLEGAKAGFPTGQVDAKAVAAAKAKGETVVALPRVIGEGELRSRSKGEKGDFARWFDRAMGGLKTSLTVANVPTYDLRNLYGDAFNSWLADTDAHSMSLGFRLSGANVRANRAERHVAGSSAARDRTVRIRGKDVPVLQWAREDGITETGHAGGEMFERSRGTTKTGVKGHLRKIRPVDALRNVGAARENAVRLGTYISALKRGMTRSEARDWVNKHHFDYTELTPTEIGVRRVVPFYTFTARNSRLQASKLIHQPGKAAKVAAFLDEAAKAAGYQDYKDFAGDQSEFQQRGIPIPGKAGGQTYPLFPSLPISDLNRVPVQSLLAALGGNYKPHDTLKDFGRTAELAGQTVNPLIKSPVELASNHSFFTGRAIYQDKTNPNAPRWVPAPSWAKTLGIPTVKIKDKQTGKMVDGWDARFDYLTRTTPQGGLVAQLATPVTGSRGQTATTKIISQLSGIRVGAPVGGAPDKLTKLFDARSTLEVRKQQLRARGLDTKSNGDRTRAYQRILDQQRRINHRIYKLDTQGGRAKPRGQAPPKRSHDPVDRAVDDAVGAATPDLKSVDAAIDAAVKGR